MKGMIDPIRRRYLPSPKMWSGLRLMFNEKYLFRKIYWSPGSGVNEVRTTVRDIPRLSDRRNSQRQVPKDAFRGKGPEKPSVSDNRIFQSKLV